ncbi:MAG: HAMP domain-containing histidine kinase [Solirubrobacterales bacterium]|nr:HAMP domain-containing histidine kinase [Solirubrobacterales bacterium]
MATGALRLVPRRWLRLPPGKARLRLTLMYSALFLVLGTLIVGVIFGVASTGKIGSTTSAAPVSAGPAPAIQQAQSQQHAADVARLLAGSFLVLLLAAGASTGLGWFAAGRVLRPLSQMANAARTITAGNLHERLGIEGPEDEFKQLGDTMDDLLTRLESSFAAQRRFVANAAHELRTPLTVERTLLQVALADPNASAATLRATCEELLDHGRDQERLLDSLLTLATGERGLELREPIDLAQVVAQVLESARASADEQRLQLRPSLGRASMLGDSALVQRLGANLVENAVSYNQPGGLIEVDTGTKAGQAFLSVANSGPEVPPEEIDRLFEPFKRLQRARTGQDGRHGLGLSIVRAIAVAHGAEVRAEPRPEGGLIVTVTFASEDTS